MISIAVNGDPLQVTELITLQELLVQLGHAGRRLAVERNGEIVPRSQHAQTRLVAGDKLEIVIAVGGG